MSTKETIVCHHRYFNHGFRFQRSVCKGVRDLLMVSPDINNIAIITAKGVDYRGIIYHVIKFDAILISEKSMLDDRRFI